MRRLLAIAMLAAACGNNPEPSLSVPSASPPQVASSDEAPSTPTTPVPPTVSPRETPTPEPLSPPQDLIVSRVWATGTARGSAVFVELRNPSAEFGLNRARFEVTLLNGNGGVVAVVGTGGVPGASCCTIYRLGPSETYLVSGYLADRGRVVSAEARTLGSWTYWPGIADDVPVVQVTGAKATRRGFSGATKSFRVRGRVSVTGGTGPYNVRVVATYSSRTGFFAIDESVACVKPGRQYAFDISSLVIPPKNAKLRDVRAFTTTVPPEQPPGC